MAIREDGDIDLYELYLIVIKRIRLIASIVVSSVLIIGAINFLKSPVYRSSFIIRVFSNISATEKNPIISTGEVEKIISELDLLRNEKQLNELSKRLSMNRDQIEKVVKFDAKTPGNAMDLVEITLDVYDRGLIPDLKNGIVQYLNHYHYVSERITMWRESKLHLKAEIQAKIQEIDEFKNIMIMQIKKDRAKYLGFNPLLLDEEVINLKQKLRDLENSIELLRGIEVTIEPEIPQTPIKPKTTLNIILAGIVSLFFSIFLSFFIEWIDKNKKILE